VREGTIILRKRRDYIAIYSFSVKNIDMKDENESAHANRFPILSGCSVRTKKSKLNKNIVCLHFSPCASA
jgi:hypothetical protein